MAMFNIHLASTYGFCRGVQCATKLADQLVASSQRPIYSIGKLVHNDAVVRRYEERGLEVIDSPEGVEPGQALVRAHGIPLEEWQAFEKAGFTLVDGTCRLVRLNHMRCAKAQHPVLFFGLRNHAETLSTISRATGWVKVVEDLCDLDDLDPTWTYDIVMQTTFSTQKAERFLASLDGRGIAYAILSRVCPASSRRRRAVLNLCDMCQSVIVLGERQSANTSELYRLAKDRGVAAWLIGSPAELEDAMIACSDVGVTAGASVDPGSVDHLIDVLEQKGGTLIRRQ